MHLLLIEVVSPLVSPVVISAVVSYHYPHRFSVCSQRRRDISGLKMSDGEPASAASLFSEPILYSEFSDLELTNDSELLELLVTCTQTTF